MNLHVAACLRIVRASGTATRDAVRCRSVNEMNWNAFDLYTLALDLCEDDELRLLVAQARGALLAELMRSGRRG